MGPRRGGGILVRPRNKVHFFAAAVDSLSAFHTGPVLQTESKISLLAMESVRLRTDCSVHQRE
jgi:hypothetical protein